METYETGLTNVTIEKPIFLILLDKTEILY